MGGADGITVASKGANEIELRLWIGGMLVLQPVNRGLSVCLLLNSLTIILLPNSSLVQGQGLSSFDFWAFNSTDKLLTSGDAVYNSSSVWLNTAYYPLPGASANYSCRGVLYAESQTASRCLTLNQVVVQVRQWPPSTPPSRSP
jgi:hypothetical protein